MEELLDSTISEQEAAAVTAATALATDGQEAVTAGEKRLNGLMSTLGRRTSERDDAVAERDAAIAERDRLWAELRGEGPEPAEPAVEAPGAEPETAQLPESSEDEDEALEAPAAAVAATAPPPFDIPFGSVVTTPDGDMYTYGVAGPGTFAPTSPKRPSTNQPEGSLEELRTRFRDQLPGYVAELRRGPLLRGQ